MNLVGSDVSHAPLFYGITNQNKIFMKRYEKIMDVMQTVAFCVAALAFVVTFVCHTVLAAAHQRWAVAVVMAVLALCSVAVIRSAAEELRKK